MSNFLKSNPKKLVEASKKFWWIKERRNPQLGKSYYIGYGKLSSSEINKKVSSYGNNKMHKFNSEQEYKKELENLKNKGFSVEEESPENKKESVLNEERNELKYKMKVTINGNSNTIYFPISAVKKITGNKFNDLESEKIKEFNVSKDCLIFLSKNHLNY